MATWTNQEPTIEGWGTKEVKGSTGDGWIDPDVPEGIIDYPPQYPFLPRWLANFLASFGYFGFVLLGIIVAGVALGVWKITSLTITFVRDRRLIDTETGTIISYKRFKELYPYSPITYREYRKLQSERSRKQHRNNRKKKGMIR